MRSQQQQPSGGDVSNGGGFGASTNGGGGGANFGGGGGANFGDQPQPRSQPEELADIEGAVAAGWREYDAGDGKLVYVNDKTYEEAPKLEKVQKLMDRAR